MSQTLVRVILVAIAVSCGTSVAFAQKVMPKQEKVKYAGIWAEDCMKRNGKWVDMVSRWVEVYSAGEMVTREGVPVFKPVGKKAYRSTFDGMQASGPDTWGMKTKTGGTLNLKLLADGKLNFDLKDPNSKYHYEFAGDLTKCK